MAVTNITGSLAELSFVIDDLFKRGRLSLAEKRYFTELTFRIHNENVLAKSISILQKETMINNAL